MSRRTTMETNTTIPMPLKAGDEFQNYKKLCEFLGEKVKSGDSKVSQLGVWKMQFNWEQVGRKYIIKEVYSPNFTSTHTILRTSKAHYHEMEKILLHMLKNKEFMYIDGAHYVSMSALAKAVGLCNNNYFDYFAKQEDLVIGRGYKSENVSDFYTRTYQLFKTDTLNILKGLKNRAMIEFVETYVVTPVEFMEESTKFNREEMALYKKELYKKLPPREATIEEYKEIQTAKYTVLQVMELSDMREVYLTKQQEKFNSGFEQLMLENYQKTHVYKAYRISFSEEVALFIEENVNKNEFNLNSQELIEKKRYITKTVKEEFHEKTEKLSDDRKENNPHKPNGYKFKREVRALGNTMLGIKGKIQEAKYRKETSEKVKENLNSDKGFTRIDTLF